MFAVYISSCALVAVISGKHVTGLWSAAVIGYNSLPVVVFIATCFVLYGWRWRIFHPWLVPFPNLNGTWQGTIQTTWKNPETGQVPGPIPTILTIKQSFGRISCVMRTTEMVSRSFLADFWLDQDEQEGEALAPPGARQRLTGLLQMGLTNKEHVRLDN